MQNILHCSTFVFLHLTRDINTNLHSCLLHKRHLLEINKKQSKTMFYSAIGLHAHDYVNSIYGDCWSQIPISFAYRVDLLDWVASIANKHMFMFFNSIEIWQLKMLMTTQRYPTSS